MEDKNVPNQELENLLRKGLEQVNQTPDGDLWEKIAASQRPNNFGLRIRHIARYAAPVAAAVALLLAGWWHFSPKNHSQAANAPIARHEKPMPVAPATESWDDAPEAPDALDLSKNNASKMAAVSTLNTVPAATLRFRAETGVKYKSPTTGTTVKIPAEALVNARGQIVRGEVELTLREYRDIPDFLASGIPMHYADDRGSFFFNSAGMFEVRVSQNGEQLSMAPGQTYDLEFPSTGNFTDVSLFRLDDRTGQWGYEPNHAFVYEPRESSNFDPSIRPPVVSEAEAIRNNRQRDNRPCVPRDMGTPPKFDAASWVKAGVRTGHELATGKKKMPNWFLKKPWLKSETLLANMERGQVRIVRNRDMGEMFFPEDVSGVFTELAAFKDCYFHRSADSIGPDKVLRTDIDFDRINIVQEAGGRCLISLYSEKHGLYQVYADLSASIGNKSFDRAKVLNEYRRLRTKRLDDFETFAENLRKFLFVAIAFQSDKEWCMHQLEWLEYFQTQHPLMAERYSALVKAGIATDDALAKQAWSDWHAKLREQLFDSEYAVATTAAEKKENLAYALRLTNFGTYNCDQIFRLGQQGDYIYAAYQTPDGGRVYPKSVSVLERNSRLFFTMSENDKLVVVPGRAMDVVVSDRDGRQYHLSSETYAKLKLEGKQSSILTVRDITDVTRTPRDWAEYLEL
ncbi:MAG: hypothetical protein ABMA02_10360 [Saprospiraceae bacterium]